MATKELTMTLLTRGVSAAAALIVAAALAGCGGSPTSAGTTTSTTAAPTGAPTGAAGRVPGGAGDFDPAELQQMQACLKAAGVTLPTGRPSGLPSGDFTPGAGRPSGFPSDFTPGAGRPSGGSGGLGVGGGVGGLFNNPEAQAALKACGISLPAFPGGGGPPTGTAT